MLDILSAGRRLACLVGLLVVASAIAVQPASAEPAVPDGEIAELQPSQDATIDSLHPLVNYGVEPDLRVVFGIDPLSGSRFQESALLQFDLSSIPLGAYVSSATLSLNLTAAAGQTAMAGYRVTSTWRESDVTFTDRPTNDAHRCSRWTCPSAPQPRQVDFDVTGLVSDWVNQTSPNFGLLLRPTATAPVERIFDSREGGTAPLLTVYYSLPPIRVCRDVVDPCTPLFGAEVYILNYHQVHYPTDSGGVVQDDGIIQLGDELWVKYLDSPIRRWLGAVWHQRPAGNGHCGGLPELSEVQAASCAWPWTARSP